MEEVTDSSSVGSTSLRQGYGWQAIALAKAVRQSAQRDGGPSIQTAPSMHYVYQIQSVPEPSRYYTGCTDNLKARLASHNAGRSPHTAKHKPWRLASYHAFANREKAVEFEAG